MEGVLHLPSQAKLEGCLPCPNCVLCEEAGLRSGGDIMLKPGYTLAEDLGLATRTLSVFKCADPAACKGEVGLANVTEGSDCAAGFGGVICSSCLRGYYKKNGACAECSVSDKGSAIVLWAGVAVGCIVAFLLIAAKLAGGDFEAQKVGARQQPRDPAGVLSEVGEVIQRNIEGSLTILRTWIKMV